MKLSGEIVTEIYQKAGALTVCWDHIDRAGEFQTSRAIGIVEELCRFIDERVTENGRAAS
jgi:hypothetical protein